MDNPLIPELLRLLQQNQASSDPGLSAYQLLQQLAGHNVFAPLDELEHQPQLQLFRKNFLLMNGLYQLQQNLWREEKLYLSVSALKVTLETLPEAVPAQANQQQQMDQAEPLRDYYLDWNNFHDTDETEVLKLLADFWTRFHNPELENQARAVLGVEADASWQQVQRRYRELAAKHHPDKGGDKRRFMEIRQAYEDLKP